MKRCVTLSISRPALSRLNDYNERMNSGESIMATVTPLDANFGAEITGLDLGKGVDTDVMQLLTDALYTHKVICIRDQSFSKDAYLEFGQQWGTPIPHVLDHMRMDGYPALMTIGNTEKRDRKDNIRNGAALWHTDQSYESEPASATMLYSIKVPSQGGETQFCNMSMAFEELDAATRDKIASLEVAHKYGYGKRRAGELGVNPLINDEQDNRVPPVYHPMVMSHPITGAKSLYAMGHGAHGIKNMDDADADEIIESMKDHVLQEKFIYRHPYRPGDLVIWDTLSTMHSATPIDIPESEQEERLLWRISVRHKPAIYA